MRTARPEDRPRIVQLLESGGLAADAVEPLEDLFGVIENEEGDIVGCVAIEGSGQDLLLRSLAVAPEARGQRYGARLVEAAVVEARGRGARRLVAVTDSAPEFFRARGFTALDPASLEPAIRRHPQLNGACPASAAIVARAIQE